MAEKYKDRDSSIGEIFRNRKRQHSSKDRNGEPTFKTNREILDQVDDDLRIEVSEGPCVDKTLAEKFSMQILTHPHSMFVCKKL